MRGWVGSGVSVTRQDSTVGTVAEDYCDLCDLPLSTCIHGMPAPPPAPAAAPAARRTPRATATPKRTVQAVQSAKPSPVRKRTEQETFRPYIVRLLQDEGSLETPEVMTHLEELMAEVLLERDRQKAPTGEVRWHTAARAERKAMIDEGLIFPAKPGVWELTDRGRAIRLLGRDAPGSRRRAGRPACSSRSSPDQNFPGS